MLQWYLTRYARLSNGEFELLTYDPMPSLAVAQYKAQTQLTNNEFYEVEYKIGSLLPKHQGHWVAREIYSHKPNVMALQINAEVKAQQVLKDLNNNTFDLKQTLVDMQVLKPILTKPQYQILHNALMSKPCVMKILYERGTL